MVLPDGKTDAISAFTSMVPVASRFGDVREDGTRDKTMASWAIAVILQHKDDSLGFVGIMGSPVSSLGLITKGLDTVKDSSASAEVLGATMAALYAIQSEEARSGSLKVSIFGDNDNARAAAEGRNRAKSMQGHVCFLRGVSRWCRNVHPSLTWHYTKAHIWASLE